MRVLRALKIIISPALTPFIQTVSVLGLALSFVVIVGGIFGEPAIAGRQIEALTKAVERYRQDCGEYPSAPEGLRTLVVNGGAKGWRGPYIKEVPLDPWRRPYVYLTSIGSAPPEVLSYGVDGKPGGEYMDADISSRNPLPVMPETPYEARARHYTIGIWIAAWLCFATSIVALRRSSFRRKG